MFLFTSEELVEKKTDHELWSTIVAIVRSELTETESLVDLDKETVEKLYLLGKKHNIYPLLGDYFLRHGFGNEDLFQDFVISQTFDQWCDSALLKISNLFDKAEIDYLPLKGIVVRNDYPKPWMRSFGDIDILVKKQDRKKARSLLSNYQIHYGKQNQEDHIIMDGGVQLDLDDSVKDIYMRTGKESMLSDIWDYAKAKEGSHCFSLRDDMRYAHAVTHMARHFLSGGCGINHFVDLWVLNHKVPVTREMIAAREALLKKKGIKRIEEAFVAVSEKWFSGENVETIDGLEEYVFNGLAHGSKINDAIRYRLIWGNSLYKLKRFIVPYDYLCQLFPRLKNHKWMTPFYEVYRWLYHIHNGRTKAIMEEFKKSDSVSYETVDKMERMMKELFG